MTVKVVSPLRRSSAAGLRDYFKARRRVMVLALSSVGCFSIATIVGLVAVVLDSSQLTENFPWLSFAGSGFGLIACVMSMLWGRKAGEFARDEAKFGDAFAALSHEEYLRFERESAHVFLSQLMVRVIGGVAVILLFFFALVHDAGRRNAAKTRSSKSISQYVEVVITDSQELLTLMDDPGMKAEIRHSSSEQADHADLAGELSLRLKDLERFSSGPTKLRDVEFRELLEVEQRVATYIAKKASSSHSSQRDALAGLLRKADSINERCSTIKDEVRLSS